MDSMLSTSVVTRRGLLAAGAAVAGLGLTACAGGTGAGSAAGSSAGSAATGNAAVTTMRVGALQGPTGMGLVGLMDNTGAVEDLAEANGTELAEDSPVGTNPADIDALANSYEFSSPRSSSKETLTCSACLPTLQRRSTSAPRALSRCFA